MDNYLKNRNLLIKENNDRNFSKDINLNNDEDKVNEKWILLNKKFFDEEIKYLDYDNFFVFKEKLLNSNLSKLIKNLPKGGIHNFHSDKMININVIKNLIYNDDVYYNIETGTFKIINKNENKLENYLSFKEIRNCFGEEYVNNIIESLTINKFNFNNLVEIQKNIFKNFKRIHELYFYKPYFILFFKNLLESLITENYTFIEIRHGFGDIFDENHKNLTPEEEIEIFKELQEYAQTLQKDFQISIIVTVKEFLGNDHLEKNLDIYKNLKNNKLVFGFDIITNYNNSDSLKDYIEFILQYEKNNNLKIDFLIDAGLTNDKRNTDVVDALLINSKRIANGLNIANYPLVFDSIKRKNICIEFSPISNFILGFTSNLRNHPTRSLIFDGLQISLNPFYYGVFNYMKTDLDLLITITQFELNLKEIKKIILNSFNYSSNNINKERLIENFNKDWNEFIQKEK